MNRRDIFFPGGKYPRGVARKYLEGTVNLGRYRNIAQLNYKCSHICLCGVGIDGGGSLTLLLTVKPSGGVVALIN